MLHYFTLFSLVFLLSLRPAAAETVSIDPPADPVVIAAPSVTMSLTATPSTIALGQQVAYTLTIKNTSDVMFTDLSASFDLPAGFSFAPNTPIDPVKNLGTLSPGVTMKKTFTLVIGGNVTPGRIPLEVLVDAHEFDLTETVAVVTVQAGRVLGTETLVDTGTSPLAIVAFGLLTASLGALILRQQRHKYSRRLHIAPDRSL